MVFRESLKPAHAGRMKHAGSGRLSHREGDVRVESCGAKKSAAS